MRILLLCVSMWMLVAPPLAADGVVEINQACAQVGCFSGDSPGFPVEIDGTAGSSYRLTSDLNVGNPNLDGLLLSQDQLDIDLGGFTILVFPAGSGFGQGIGGTGRFTTIRNGTIRGARGMGILIPSEGVRVENVVLDFNAGGGVELGDGAQVIGNRLSSNGSTSGRSIIVLANSRVEGNVVSGSGGFGIDCNDGSIVSGNAVSGGGSIGILARNSLVTGNTVTDNGDNGIHLNGTSTVTGNNVHSNGGDGIQSTHRATISGNTVRSSGEDGIQSAAGLVQANTVSESAEYGLNLTTTSAVYRENVVTLNTLGGVTGSGTNRGDNYCNGANVMSDTCP